MLLLALVTVAPVLAPASAPALHGGSFRRPPGRPGIGSPVGRPSYGPPGGSPPPGKTPGGIPRVGAPLTGGPRVPAPGAGGPTTPGGSGRVNSFDWSDWWDLERDDLLRYRDRVRSAGVQTGGPEALRLGWPNEDDVRGWVLPILLKILRTETELDLVTASLIATARIGSRCDADGVATIFPELHRHMRSRRQEVSETAVLSLGILGDTRSLPLLIDVVSGSPEGAKAVGRGTVSSRTRAFAAFALGLAAQKPAFEPERQRIAVALMGAISGKHAHDEVPTAAVIALGLCPVPIRPTVPPQDLRSSEWVDGVVSRGGQIAWLSRWMEQRNARGVSGTRHSLAHAQVALARLAAGTDGATRASVGQRLRSVATSKRDPIPRRTAALLGLGELARGGDDPSDIASRKVLIELLKRGQPLQRRFAAIALARASSRPGSGDDPLAGVEDSRKVLIQQVVRGRSGEETWGALALGLQAFHLARLRQPNADGVGAVLIDRMRRERSAADVGAFASGLALAYLRSGAPERERGGRNVAMVFKKMRDPAARGHLALALGILRYEPARKDLRELLKVSRFQPALHWSVAVALGLLGDSDVGRTLVDSIERAKSGSARAAAAAALGTVGTRTSLGPLTELVLDEDQTAVTRAFGVIGLGILCDEEPVPWRHPIAHALPYFALTETLTGNMNGLLDIL